MALSLTQHAEKYIHWNAVGLAMLHNILFCLQSEVQCTAMCLSSWLLWRIANYIDSRSIFVFTKSWGIAMDQFPQLMVDRTQTRMSRALAWGDRKLETLIAHYSISVAWLLELVASEDFTKRLAVTWVWSTTFGFDHHSWGGCFSNSTAWICNKYWILTDIHQVPGVCLGKLPVVLSCCEVGRGQSQLVPRLAPHNPRLFTPRECARIMGFTESYQLGEGSRDRCKALYSLCLGSCLCHFNSFHDS